MSMAITYDSIEWIVLIDHICHVLLKLNSTVAKHCYDIAVRSTLCGQSPICA